MKLLEFFHDELVHKMTCKETSGRLRRGVEIQKEFEALGHDVVVMLGDDPTKGLFGYLVSIAPASKEPKVIDLRVRIYDEVKKLVVHDTWESLERVFLKVSTINIPIHKFDDVISLRLGFVVQCADGAEYHGVSYKELYEVTKPPKNNKQDEQKENA